MVHTEFVFFISVFIRLKEGTIETNLAGIAGANPRLQ